MPRLLCSTKYTRSQIDVKYVGRAPVLLLLRLDVGVADHLAPFRRVGADAGGEVLGRAYDRVDEARRKNAVAEWRVGEDALGLRIELVHNGGRRAGGREQPVPGAGLVAGEAAPG